MVECVKVKLSAVFAVAVQRQRVVGRDRVYLLGCKKMFILISDYIDEGKLKPISERVLKASWPVLTLRAKKYAAFESKSFFSVTKA